MNIRRLRRARATLTLLALCIALGGTGLACDGGNYGVTFVGTDAEGTLVAEGLRAQFGGTDLHQSDDGGFSWQFAGETDLVPTVGTLQATTPGGTYQIIPSEIVGDELEHPLEARIVRTLQGRNETIFSMAQLLDNANITLQQRTRWGAEAELYSIHYDADSGNVIAAMGTQGVLVGTPEGRWIRVGVGRFVPTDFSAGARTRLLATTPSFWLSTLAVSVLFTATAFVLAVARRWEFASAITIAAGIVAAAYAFYLVSGLEPLSAVVLLTLLVLVLGIIALSLLLIWDGESRKRKSLALAVVGLVLASAIFVFPGFAGLSLLALLLWPPIFVIVGLSTLSLAAVAIWPYRPDGREWCAIGVLVSSMILVSAVPVVLWMQYIISYETAKSISIGLAAVIAIGLFVWLKNQRRSDEAAIARN